MFNSLYTFFYDWLFGGVAPTYLSAQGAEFATIVFAVITLIAVISLALIPIKALVRFVCGGWF